jgi:hypothetical protein
MSVSKMCIGQVVFEQKAWNRVFAKWKNLIFQVFQSSVAAHLLLQPKVKGSYPANAAVTEIENDEGKKVFKFIFKYFSKKGFSSS